MRATSGGHGERRAKDSRHADHRRPRRHDARAVWRLRGLLQLQRNLDTCITIRTALLKDGKAYVPTGGAG